MPSHFIHALALIKRCAASVNQELGLLDANLADAIESAASEVGSGSFDDQFVVDVFQTGSGTSTNMNINEVLASRANEILTGNKGGRAPVHQNDHVNMGQSSNDVIPSAIHLSVRTRINEDLLPALENLHGELSAKADAFADIPKLGRTHLQDAVPMTLGQEFSGYARQVELAMERIRAADPRLAELAIGGTAIGTGLNTHPEFAGKVCGQISEDTGLVFIEAGNHFEAQAAKDTAVEVSGVLKSIAVGLTKIANDIRWLASGPRSGIGEITLPSLQPGSSIMPGKVNPVIPEAVLQVTAQVVGNDATITLAGQSGIFELNVMMPVIAFNLIQSVDLLASAASVLRDKCIEGITPNVETCEGYIEQSLAMVTGLVPHIGYDNAAALAKKAYASGKTIRQVAEEERVLPSETLDKILKIG